MVRVYVNNNDSGATSATTNKSNSNSNSNNNNNNNNNYYYYYYYYYYYHYTYNDKLAALLVFIRRRIKSTDFHSSSLRKKNVVPIENKPRKLHNAINNEQT